MRGAARATAVGAGIGLLGWAAFTGAAWLVDAVMAVLFRWQDKRCGAQERTET